MSDNGAAVLPAGLTAEALQGEAVWDEAEFWNATTAAVHAPYCSYSKELVAMFSAYQPVDWAILYQNGGTHDALGVLFQHAVVLPNECDAGVYSISAKCSVLMTNYRMVVVDGNSVTPIPWEQFVSWSDGIVRWTSNATQRELKIGKSLEDIGKIESLRSAADWTSLNPLQIQLLSATRWGIKKSLGFDLPPLDRAVGKAVAEAIREAATELIRVGAEHARVRAEHAKRSSALRFRSILLVFVVVFVLPIIGVLLRGY